jgi:hypothetical protein
VKAIPEASLRNSLAAGALVAAVVASTVPIPIVSLLGGVAAIILALATIGLSIAAILSAT